MKDILNAGAVHFDFEKRRVFRDSFWKGSFAKDSLPGWEERRAASEWLLVEDHSHDPFSPWAVGSSADYAFCSLRKTLPVPDGGLLWS
jgi:hypothetical protein